MTSTIKVDTISEKTSANGVTIDSVKLKDGTVDVNGVSDGIILDADADTTISADTDDQIDFKTGGTDRMNIDSSGNVTVKGSNADLTFASSGNNINFARNADNYVSAQGGTSSNLILHGQQRVVVQTDSTERFRVTSAGIHIGGTGSANAFDDYEEGTYAYTITGSNSGNLGVRSGYARGSYVKVGNLVHVDLRFETDTDNSIDGNIRWSLPFTMATPNGSDADACTAPGYIRDNSMGTDARTGVYLLSQGDAYVQYLFSREGAANSTVEVADHNDTDGVLEGNISISYRTT